MSAIGNNSHQTTRALGQNFQGLFHYSPSPTEKIIILPLANESSEYTGYSFEWGRGSNGKNQLLL